MRVVFHVCTIVLGIIMIYPLLYMVFSSFKTAQDIAQNPTSLWPNPWYLMNYVNGWAGFGDTTFTTFFANSIIITVVAVLGQIASSALIAYGFARMRFRLRSFWFSIMIVTMMMPVQVLIVPQYIMFNNFGWVNTWLPLIVPGFFGYPFFIFLIYQFIQGIPRELDEAAFIDGSSKYGIFFRIILPLIKPAMATMAVLCFQGGWNNFLMPYVVLPDRMLVLSTFIRTFPSDNYAVSMAASMVATIPVLVLFIFFQKYFMNSIALSGLKE